MGLIVFDLDGVVVDIHDYIYKKLNIDASKVKRYNIDECSLTTDEIRKIKSEFGNKEVYLHSKKLGNGIQNIKDTINAGYKVAIHSLALNEDVEKAKQLWLMRHIPKTYLNKIKINIVIGKEKTNVHEVFNCDIKAIIEDNLEYLSRQKCDKKILIDREHNREINYNINCGDIIRVNSSESLLKYL